MDWTYFASKLFQFLEFASDDSTSPNPVPAKPPKIMAQGGSRGVRSHEMLQLPNLGNFGFDSPTAIFCQTFRWKSGGICGSTLHSANFSLRSSSPIRSVKHRVLRKPSSFFAERMGDDDLREK